MLKAFTTYIENEQLFSKTDKILLAVSGGIDSVVICELFHKAGLKFGIAHCNFQLRKEDSNSDEEFVEALASKYNVRYHSAAFKTSSYAKKNKLSIQLAARQLRYHWFEEIRSEYKYNYIATAHHQDDSIETFFINLVRGTGISGLHGILPKQRKVIRPLLFTNKEEILLFAKKNKLNFREDSSNASDKYTRNKIRHHITPVLKELNPDFENTMANNIHRLKEMEQVYKNGIESKRSEIVKIGKDAITMSIQNLQKLSPLKSYLYEFLNPYHFNANTVEEIIQSLNKESGKQFFSSTHRLIKDRKSLLITGIEAKPGNKIKVPQEQESIEASDIKLYFKTLKKTENIKFKASNTIANIDFDKLSFPLEIRKWKQGDTFYPLGMKGKKKLSDFFIDKKLSIHQKENTWLLTSAGKIVWVIGLRIDDRFKITDTTRKIYFAELV